MAFQWQLSALLLMLFVLSDCAYGNNNTTEATTSQAMQTDGTANATTTYAPNSTTTGETSTTGTSNMTSTPSATTMNTTTDNMTSTAATTITASPSMVMSSTSTPATQSATSYAATTTITASSSIVMSNTPTPATQSATSYAATTTLTASPSIVMSNTPTPATSDAATTTSAASNADGTTTSQIGTEGTSSMANLATATPSTAIQPGDSGTTQGDQASTNDAISTTQATESPTPTTPQSPTVEIRAVVTVNGENFTEVLANVSSPEFAVAKEKWERKLRAAYCNATSDARNGTCNITIVVTGFSRGSLVVGFIVIVSGPSVNEVNNVVASVLNSTDIKILDDSGKPYNLTISGLTVIMATQPPVTATETPKSNLVCFSCNTFNLTHGCYIGATASSAFNFQSETCNVGESCLTIKTSNTTHTSIFRGCASTDTYCDDMNMVSMSCKDAQTTAGMEKKVCSRCCNTSECNYMDAGSSRPIPALLLLLVAVLTARTM